MHRCHPYDEYERLDDHITEMQNHTKTTRVHVSGARLLAFKTSMTAQGGGLNKLHL